MRLEDIIHLAVENVEIRPEVANLVSLLKQVNKELYTDTTSMWLSDKTYPSQGESRQRQQWLKYQLANHPTKINLSPKQQQQILASIEALASHPQTSMDNRGLAQTYLCLTYADLGDTKRFETAFKNLLVVTMHDPSMQLALTARLAQLIGDDVLQKHCDKGLIELFKDYRPLPQSRQASTYYNRYNTSDRLSKQIHRIQDIYLPDEISAKIPSTIQGRQPNRQHKQKKKLTLADIYTPTSMAADSPDKDDLASNATNFINQIALANHGMGNGKIKPSEFFKSEFQCVLQHLKAAENSPHWENAFHAYLELCFNEEVDLAARVVATRSLHEQLTKNQEVDVEDVISRCITGITLPDFIAVKNELINQLATTNILERASAEQIKTLVDYGLSRLGDANHDYHLMMVHLISTIYSTLETAHKPTDEIKYQMMESIINNINQPPSDYAICHLYDASEAQLPLINQLFRDLQPEAQERVLATLWHEAQKGDLTKIRILSEITLTNQEQLQEQQIPLYTMLVNQLTAANGDDTLIYFDYLIGCLDFDLDAKHEILIISALLQAYTKDLNSWHYDEINAKISLVLDKLTKPAVINHFINQLYHSKQLSSAEQYWLDILICTINDDSVKTSMITDKILSTIDGVSTRTLIDKLDRITDIIQTFESQSMQIKAIESVLDTFLKSNTDFASPIVKDGGTLYLPDKFIALLKNIKDPTLQIVMLNRLCDDYLGKGLTSEHLIPAATQFSNDVMEPIFTRLLNSAPLSTQNLLHRIPDITRTANAKVDNQITTLPHKTPVAITSSNSPVPNDALLTDLASPMEARAEYQETDYRLALAKIKTYLDKQIQQQFPKIHQQNLMPGKPIPTTIANIQQKLIGMNSADNTLCYEELFNDIKQLATDAASANQERMKPAELKILQHLADATDHYLPEPSRTIAKPNQKP